ncbi:MAG: prepilin-type N-terminal cleavage/methylation domain-containing protein [Sedimentisphaerales bacterium]|nr:prepilin-type N-terminal cleavage/methylation domain-containing protein [Sedimentisphaerales bacterium]
MSYVVTQTDTLIMNEKKQQSGFTLIEMLVVVAIIAVLAALSLPNTMGIIRSHRAAATKNLIRNALAQAQAHAAVTQKYAGVRFQFTKDQWQNNRQYLVLIENEPGLVPAVGGIPVRRSYDRFVAIRNAKAAALPVGMGVISQAASGSVGILDDYGVDSVRGETTFSIIFSPMGQLVTKDVYLRPKDDFDAAGLPIFSDDAIVNTQSDVDNGIGLLYCDDDGSVECRWGESSALGLYIFDADKLMSIDGLNMNDIQKAEERAIYIQSLEPILINIYTGTIIKEEFNI